MRTLVRTACSTDGSTAELVDSIDDEQLDLVRALLSQRYDKIAPLGEGGFGVVVRAYDKLLRRTVAIKCFTSLNRNAEQRRLRSQNEHYITAGLRHPGIVAVHDRDPKEHCKWFAMEHVEGETLRQSIAKGPSTVTSSRYTRDPSPPHWERLRVLSQAVEVVAYAHRRNIAHFDLKPENIMVSGERVYVLDWGLARELGTTSAEDPTPLEAGLWGTFEYMSPEQAGAPAGKVGLSSDVFAIGLILFELVEERPAYNVSGSHRVGVAREGNPPPLLSEVGAQDISPNLRDIYRKATAFRVEDRYRNAIELAQALRSWFDAQERRVRSDKLLQAAQQQQTQVLDSKNEIDRAQSALRKLRSLVQPADGIEQKTPLWQEQDALENARVELTRLRTKRLEMLLGAAAVDPSSPRARKLLFSHYADDYRAAERAGSKHEMARYHALMAQQSSLDAQDFMSRGAPLTLVTTPPGARVTCQRYNEALRRLTLSSEVRELGTTPLVGVMLQSGSYLLRIEHPNHATVVYPVLIRRDKPWHGKRPGQDTPHPIVLPARGSLSPDDCYVPAGWCQLGGDPLAIDGIAAQDLWIDAFVIKRAPVTEAEYSRFIRALLDEGKSADAHRFAPKERATRHQQQGSAPPQFVSMQGARRDSRLPAVTVSLDGAIAYCQWRAKQDGQPWRLAHGLEREKAARGADGRLFPWGYHFDPAFTWALETQQEFSKRATVDDHRCDISPYGVTSLCGNIRDLCRNPWLLNGPELHSDILRIDAEVDPADAASRVTVRGGSWESVGWTARAASRFVLRTSDVRYNVGFRLARSLHNNEPET